MKVLLLHPGPSFSVADVCNGWAKGFQQAGCSVAVWNLNDRLEFFERAHISDDGGPFKKAFTTQEAALLASETLFAQVYKWWPDLIVVVSGFYTDPSVYEELRRHGHKVVLLHTESPYEDPKQIRVAPAVDLNVLNDPTNLEAFRAVNSNSVFFGHAYDPDVHHPTSVAPSRDFVFVGTGYPSRIDFLEAVDWPTDDVTLAGNWQGLREDSPLRPFVGHAIDACIDNTATADLYRTARASANLYRVEGTGSPDGWAMGPREVELAACGTFYLTEARGENRQVLPMVPTFDGPEDFADVLGWWLNHPDKRADVARRAQAAVAGRTFADSARRLLRLVDTLT